MSRITTQLRARHSGLTCDNRIAHGDMPTVGVEYFVREAIGIPYSYSTGSALPGIRHNTIHRRAQGGVREIDSFWSNGIVEINPAMRRRSLISYDSVGTRDAGRHSSNRRQYAPHDIFPRHIDLQCVLLFRKLKPLRPATGFLKINRTHLTGVVG